MVTILFKIVNHEPTPKSTDDGRYTVVGDGRGGGAKMRAGAALKSKSAGEAKIGAEVRIDMVPPSKADSSATLKPPMGT